MPSMTETPNSEMKPIAAETLKSSPAKYSAMMPPPIAKGMPATASRLSRSELNRPYSSTRIRTQADRHDDLEPLSWRFCRSSNSPAQMIRYPFGSLMVLAMRSCASATVLPRSRPRTLNLIGMKRWLRSR